MSFEIKLRAIHFFNHLMLIPAFVYGEWWMWIASYAWWAVIGAIGISAGFHRYLSHKAYRTYGWFEKFSLTVGCLATGGTPLGWAGAHRMHHAYADTELNEHGGKFMYMIGDMLKFKENLLKIYFVIKQLCGYTNITFSSSFFGQ